MVKKKTSEPTAPDTSASSEGSPQHELKFLPVDQIVPNSWNVQTQDEATFNRLVEEIKEHGCIAPIQVVSRPDGTYLILGGEHRWKASVTAGLEEIPAMVLNGAKWSDADLQKLESVRLNALSGKIDTLKFAKLYQEMADRHGKDAVQGMMAITDTQMFQKLIGDVKRGLKRSLPKEMHAQIDSQAKTAKSTEDITQIVSSLMNRYGDTVDRSFMVFSYGSSEHVYIQMSSKTKRSLDKVLNYCRESGDDLAEFFAPIIEAAAKEAMMRLKASSKDSPPINVNEV